MRHLVHFLLGFQELLLQNVRDLRHEILLAVALVLVEHLFQRQKLVVADERCQFDLQVLRIQERVFLVIISDGHRYLIHAEVLEEHWEILHDHLLFLAAVVQWVLLHNQRLILGISLGGKRLEDVLGLLVLLGASSDHVVENVIELTI